MIIRALKTAAFVLGILVIIYLGLQVEAGYRLEQKFSEVESNYFKEDNGLFEFSYRSDHEVKFVDGVYYLRDLVTGDIAFQVFRDTDEIEYSGYDYECSLGEEDGSWNDVRVCYSLETPESIVADLHLFVGLNEGERFYRYSFLSRGEYLKRVLNWGMPEMDFDLYAEDCFDDVSEENALSGYICYAKLNGIIFGIGDLFYPESSINLWGVFKILFLVFDEGDMTYDETKLDPDMFEVMTPYHHAYDLMAKAYYEGLFSNIHSGEVWPNRNVYLEEAESIIRSFIDWQHGRKIKNYGIGDEFELTAEVFVREEDRDFDFYKDEEDLWSGGKRGNKDVELIEVKDGVEVYFEKEGRVYEYLWKLEEVLLEDVFDVEVEMNEGRIEAELLVEFVDGNVDYYVLQVKEDDFEYLKKDARNVIDDPYILPNLVTAPSLSSVAKVNVSMAPEDFEMILKNRTFNTRYPAHVEIDRPGEDLYAQSAVIKTRGNANRGYIKPSFTIEPFNEREFKMRSLIADESMIFEKLVYGIMEDLGYLAPKFEEAVLEINGVPFGFYQITEPIDDQFFADREVDVDYYYYARNVTSPYPANMAYQENDEITLAHYDVYGGKDADEKLIRFIKGLDADDESLYEDIDVQNVFDYAMLTFLINAHDSMTHNYYLYRENGEWKMFLWDADEGFLIRPETYLRNFEDHVNDHEGRYNNLVYYVFDNMGSRKFASCFSSFVRRWVRDVDVLDDLRYYRDRYENLFEYDNALWNGKHFERKQIYFDTMSAIDRLEDDFIYTDRQVRKRF